MTKIYYESDADLSVLDGQRVGVVGYGNQSQWIDRWRRRENPKGDRRDDHRRVDAADLPRRSGRVDEFGTCNRTGAARGDPGG